MNHCRQAGFSLVEFLFASLIGSLVMLMLMRTLVVVKSGSQDINLLASLQQNERFAFVFLQHEWGQAGIVTACQYKKKELFRLQGYYDNQPKAWKNTAKRHTGMLVIGKCQRYKGKQVYFPTAYFLGRDNTVKRDSLLKYALYQKFLGKRRLKLITGVVAMRLYYWVYQKNNKLKRLLATQVKHWVNVKEIEAHLLFASIQRVPHPNQYFWFNGERKVNSSKHWLHSGVVYVSLQG